ncbi:hypothetical protein [Streptomyces flavofungini]|uniref:hypothetical protein n=1 Tax=Streptomyces flavofungini TaxID=68200 RepID=UPI0025AF2CD2|nr:hypothetical protein [Streptomyces flavofungini]WJV44636.1 hypothetical protein QUY26_03290 [Streptomyces flavofungini]
MAPLLDTPALEALMQLPADLPVPIESCDEYPTKTTYEGAAASEYDPRFHKRNFSVRALPKKSGGAAGILLAQYYDKNRVIDGPDDGFLMKTTT